MKREIDSTKTRRGEIGKTPTAKDKERQRERPKNGTVI